MRTENPFPAALCVLSASNSRDNCILTQQLGLFILTKICKMLAMELGLVHSLRRYKLKFHEEKIDQNMASDC